MRFPVHVSPSKISSFISTEDINVSEMSVYSHSFVSRREKIKDWRMKEKTGEKSVCYFKLSDRGPTNFVFSAILAVMCWAQMHHRHRNLRSVDPMNCYKQTQEGVNA